LTSHTQSMCATQASVIETENREHFVIADKYHTKYDFVIYILMMLNYIHYFLMVMLWNSQILMIIRSFFFFFYFIKNSCYIWHLAWRCYCYWVLCIVAY